MKQQIIERFLKYVQVYTESEAFVDAIPSTQRQFDLAHILVDELKAIGMVDVTLDEHCYVMATLPSNSKKDIPAIGFIAHMDTSPDFTAENVKPQVWENYDGKDIVLNKGQNIVLQTKHFPEIKQYKGQTIITTDGTTLLGADDKAGITEIMTAMEYLINHPEIEHGPIKVCFTPDEEVGRGAELFDVEKFGAEWAYTLDGGQIGELEFENFNAAYAKVIFKGKMVHPGYANGKMINSQHIAREFMNELPFDEVPERTKGYQGFFHLLRHSGSVEESILEFIIRDHNLNHFNGRKALFEEMVKQMNEEFEVDRIFLELKDQYFNMRKFIEPIYHIVEIAEQAMKDLDIVADIKPIRGGTDGAALSYKGLPCPNIFAGGHNFHGRFEYVPVESMQKAVEVIVRIAEITAETQVK